MTTNATIRITARTRTGTDPVTKQPQYSDPVNTDYPASRQDLRYEEIIRRTGDQSIRRMSDAFVPPATSISSIKVQQMVSDVATGETGVVHSIDRLENSLLIRWDDED